MIYLCYSIDEEEELFDIAICEREASAQVLEARGYTRCSYARYRWLWALQDRRAANAMMPEIAPLMRAVGTES